MDDKLVSALFFEYLVCCDHLVFSVDGGWYILNFYFFLDLWLFFMYFLCTEL